MYLLPCLGPEQEAGGLLLRLAGAVALLQHTAAKSRPLLAAKPLHPQHQGEPRHHSHTLTVVAVLQCDLSPDAGVQAADNRRQRCRLQHRRPGQRPPAVRPCSPGPRGHGGAAARPRSSG